MSVNETLQSNQDSQEPMSLATAAARNLSTTTKTVPQMQEITSRWLLRLLPWTNVAGGVYRVNRRLTYAIGDGRVSFSNIGASVRVVPPELCELPLLHDFDREDEALPAMADRFVQMEFDAGRTIVEIGNPSDQVFLLAHGKAEMVGPGKYGEKTVLCVLADGDHFGDRSLLDPETVWEYTIRAVSPCTVLMLPQRAFDELLIQSETLRAHVEQVRAQPEKPMNTKGEAEIAMAAGHSGEPSLPATFVDYELSPREYELSVAQTVLRVHSRVADLYNEPMNQVEQQLRLTIEALRERQEHEMINNRDFGLLHNADLRQRIQTRSGRPTPDDMDELLSRRRKTRFFFAHPKAIAAFGRECNRRGIYPDSVDVLGHAIPAWRGVPILPCNKIPVSKERTSPIIAMRVGEEDQGVVGLHQIGIPDEYQPGLSVRFMGINEKAIISYLVSAYYSVAILIPDALGVLENVEIGHYYDLD